MSASLSELLQQAQRLANEAKLLVTHSPLERTLPEVLRETEQMHARITGALAQPEENIRQARMMFGQNGIDLQLLIDKIEKLDMGKSFEPSDTAWDSDVAHFLTTKLQNTILDVIEETNSNIFKSVEKRTWRSLYSEWEKEKGLLLNDLFECREKITAPTALNCTEMLYAKALITYNKFPSKYGSLVTIFTQQSWNNDEITKMWKVLEHMAKQWPLYMNSDAVRTRQEAPQFLKQSRLYLEYTYRDYMTKVVQRSRKLSKCGGNHSVYGMIKSFVSTQLQQPKFMDDLCQLADYSLWPYVFYSLRCGAPGAALKFLTVCNDGYPDLRIIIQHDFENDPDLCKQNLWYIGMRASLKSEYCNILRCSNDPFKRR